MLFTSADGVVGEALFAHVIGIVQIAAVEDQRLFERLADGVEIGTAEQTPFGDDHQRIGVGQRLHRLAHNWKSGRSP
jgi:hypothetical protein